MEVKNLTYKSELNNLNYTFSTEKIYGIVGKRKKISLFLELIRGLIKPTKGKIIGNNSSFMLFESSENQIFNDTIREEIVYGLDDSKIDLVDICEKLHISEDMWNKNPYNLSLGEKRKIVFASMIASNPNVVLIDNFLNSIDFQNQRLFINVLKRMQFDDKKLIIIADENINLLYEIVDEVIVLDDEIINSGSKEDVFKNIDLLIDLDIEIPKYIEFSNMVKARKEIELPYRDRITDIVKDVYDNV